MEKKCVYKIAKIIEHRDFSSFYCSLVWVITIRYFNYYSRRPKHWVYYIITYFNRDKLRAKGPRTFKQLLSVNITWQLNFTESKFCKHPLNASWPWKHSIIYLLALSHKPSRIDLTFFSLLTEGAKTDACKSPMKESSTLSKEEVFGRNQGTNARYIPGTMVVNHISGYSQQRHVRHKSASRKWKPADL